MRINVYIHRPFRGNDDVIDLLKHVICLMTDKGVKVAESPEVTAFRESVSASLENISADIQRLLDRPNSLSQEDKDALAQIASSIQAVADVVPEP